MHVKVRVKVVSKNIITKLDESCAIKAYCVDRFDRRCPVRFHFFQVGGCSLL